MDFDLFYNWARRELNINLQAYKQKQLQRRITTIMKKSGATNLNHYAKLIEKDMTIKNAFLNYITINVTDFFRNKHLFEEFENITIDKLIPRFGLLNIWSAACSIGSEPYSLAITLDKNNKRVKRILGTDIDDKALERAIQGIYKEHEMKNVKPDDLNRYFTIKDNNYHLNKNIRDMVQFKKHDLILDNYESGFHIIICRNVVIYFNNDTKNHIYKKMSDSLVSGGILFTGATESIYNPSEFGFRKLSTFIYERI